MIYLVIQGACGNQFFQYAFARAMQEKTGEKLIIDYKWVENNEQLWNSGEDVLQYFNTKYERGSADYIIQNRMINFIQHIERKLGLKYFTRKRYLYQLLCAKLFNRLGVYYFDACYYKFPMAKTKNKVIKGFFESSDYFKEIDDIIKKELTPRYDVLEQNRDIYDRILNSQSVCITIKRCDIENTKISDVYEYSLDYFYNAVKYIKNRIKNIKLFIFSDDIEWCKNNLEFEEEMIFEKDDNPIWEKMRLMSSCKYFVIHNSTFSWWAQHLSEFPDKIVIAPPKWMQRDDQPIDIYEEGWIYMTNDGTVSEKHE